MNYRRFGSTSLRVSEIGFGCSRLAGTVEQKSDEDIAKVLLDAFDRGVNFYDTADIYGRGRSEQILGKVFKHKRTDVIIATKAGYHLTATGSFGARLKPLLRPLVRAMPSINRSVQRARASQQRQDFSPECLKRAIDRSLVRLQTDYLDIFQLHNPDSSTLERGDFIESLEHAKFSGKVRWFGVSCRTIEDAPLCLRYPSISSVQIPLNLLRFSEALSFLAIAQQNHMAVIARQPLASGLLVRKGAALGPNRSSLGEENTSQEELKAAKAYGFVEVPGFRTISQAALQFVLQLPGVSVVITGMSNRMHLEDNLGASAACPLTQEELAQIYSRKLPTSES